MRLLLKISIAFLVSCSQPFDFELAKDQILVVDAKASTLPGESFVRIYAQADSSKIILTEYEVQLRSADDIFEFKYDQSSGNYLPNNPQFVATQGVAYRFEAISRSGSLLASSYDTVPSQTDFEISIQDTIISTLNNQTLVRRRAKTAVAKVNTNASLSKYSFSYDYVHFFTKEVLTVDRFNNFVLFDHGESEGSLTALEISVEPLEDAWFFWDPTCGPVEPPCGLPCCRKFTEYQVLFQIKQESLSALAFEYWEQVSQLTRGDGLIFDTFPFPLEGNISCDKCNGEVVGFFRAVSENTKTKSTTL